MLMCNAMSQLSGIFYHFEVWHPHEDIVNLIGGDRVWVSQLLGELVDPPHQENVPQPQHEENQRRREQQQRHQPRQEGLLVVEQIGDSLEV